MNSKQIKALFGYIEAQYGISLDKLKALPYAFCKQTRENKLYYVNRETAEIELEKLRVNSLGCYLGEYNTDKTQIRLSIEGSQLFGILATKNILVLDDAQFGLWMKGEQLAAKHLRITNQKGYMIIQNVKGDFFGVGRVKDGLLLSFVPKVRRVNSIME